MSLAPRCPGLPKVTSRHAPARYLLDVGAFGQYQSITLTGADWQRCVVPKKISA